MRKTSLTLIALCATSLWAVAVYANGAPNNPGDQGYGSGCPFFFEQQMFPATGQTTSYGAGDDGAIQAGAPLTYTDNGDGTISDNNTKLMWEKKDQYTNSSGEPGIHNWTNVYTWTSSSGGTTTDGTVFSDFLTTLNTPPCFANHCDWRIPNVRELQSIVDYAFGNSLGTVPTVDKAFNNNCTPDCTVDGAHDTTECSCTQPDTSALGVYWSGTTNVATPPNAWYVGFGIGDGDVGNTPKVKSQLVRAVRCGSVRPNIR